MRNLILILLAFIAVFTFIRAIDTAGAAEKSGEISAEVSVKTSNVIPAEIPVEITH